MKTLVRFKGYLTKISKDAMQPTNLDIRLGGGHTTGDFWVMEQTGGFVEFVYNPKLGDGKRQFEIRQADLIVWDGKGFYVVMGAKTKIQVSPDYFHWNGKAVAGFTLDEEE